MSDRLLTSAELAVDLLKAAASLRNILDNGRALGLSGDHQRMLQAIELVPWAESVRAKWAAAYREAAAREAAEEVKVR